MAALEAAVRLGNHEVALLENILANYDKAEKYVSYALERAAQFRGGNRVGELLTLRAQIEIARGNCSQAAKTLDEALPLVKRKSPVEEIASTLVTLGEFCLPTEQFEKAKAAFAEALDVAPAEHLPLLALGKYGQARTAAARGDKREARRLGGAAFGVLRQIHHYRVKEVEEWLAQYRHPWLRLFPFGRRRTKEARPQPGSVPTEASA